MLNYKKEFIEYLKNIKRYSENTIKNYEIDLQNYEEYLKVIKTSEAEVSIMDIEEFKSFLGSKYQASTINRKLAGIKAYYNYLERINVIDNNPTKLVGTVKEPKRVANYLNLKEVRKLLNVIDNIRDRLIVELFISTGLRKEELRNIKLKDISEDMTISIIGKGNKERRVKINKSVEKTLKKYLKERKSDNPYLFVSKQNNQISSGALNNVIKKYSKKAKLENVTPHTLRHTCGTILYSKTKDIRLVQEYLGHESINTTERYIHMSKDSVSRGSDILEEVI